MQNRQAISHEATSHNLFLKVIISQGLEVRFSDAQMNKALPEYSLNTIRKIRKTLQRQKIIHLVDGNCPNNEKSYIVKNRDRLFKLTSYYLEILAPRTFGKIDHRKNCSYFGKFGPSIRIKYYPRSTEREQFDYPKKLYRKNICPLCQGKLRGFKNKFGQLDKKCPMCKFTFYVGTYILACEKPIKNNKPIRIDPWQNNYHSARQKGLNKIVGKILRESKGL